MRDNAKDDANEGCPQSLDYQGTGHGARETALGTLGKVTTLRVPPKLQELTLRFGTATWKRDTEDPQRKLVLLSYSNGSHTNHKGGRRDGQLYEYSVSTGPEEKVWQIQLEVYEPVSAPTIQLLHQALVNSSCAVTLNCTAERGDGVSYHWSGTSEPCAHNGSVLRLSYPLQNVSIACACTASNPVSRRVVAYNFSECGYERGAGRERDRERSPLAEDNAVHTIYSKVQRVETPSPDAEPRTIYASVMMPTA
ncbi:PREDICTED: signaling lymphocytic activation molecule-like [Mesitornis unicolor]|uniref:signaling lymphocytic activation molecule-like n=1 Tax=Mesitornis unicolor TaxID=54374 RepID=UPI0005287CD2|nr:PREDICTED: signaling lymphocytic activation molecule-like [Mesitornis unicolor]